MSKSASVLRRYKIALFCSRVLFQVGMLGSLIWLILILLSKDLILLPMPLIGFCFFIYFQKLWWPNEYDFASKYDMTHLLDIDSNDERFEAYKHHLSEWINSSNREEVNPIRERGADPSGPDWGKTDFKLGQEPQRRDAIIEGEKYKGLEDDLTEGEKLVADANEKYTIISQKRWEDSERKDPDLIEYGVERLGDLVKTDYFDKNAEEGVFEKIANEREEYNE